MFQFLKRRARNKRHTAQEEIESFIAAMDAKYENDPFGRDWPTSCDILNTERNATSSPAIREYLGQRMHEVGSLLQWRERVVQKRAEELRMARIDKALTAIEEHLVRA